MADNILIAYFSHSCKNATVLDSLGDNKINGLADWAIEAKSRVKRKG